MHAASANIYRKQRYAPVPRPRSSTAAISLTAENVNVYGRRMCLYVLYNSNVVNVSSLCRIFNQGFDLRCYKFFQAFPAGKLENFLTGACTFFFSYYKYPGIVKVQLTQRVKLQSSYNDGTISSFYVTNRARVCARDT